MAADGTGRHVESDRRPIALPGLAAIVLTLVAVLALIGTTVLLIRGVKTVKVYVPARDFPAFYRLTEPDVRERDLPARNIPDNVVTGRDELIGRYTLRKVIQDKPITEDALGPEVPEGALRGRLAVGLTISTAQALAGELAAGDEVDLLPVGSAEPYAPLRGALVLDVRPVEENSYALLLAITKKQVPQLAKLRSGSIRVVRSKPYMRQ